MSGTDYFEEGSISLFDLFDRLRAGWRWVIGGLLIGGAGAWALLAVIQPLYQASVSLEAGKVAGEVIEDVSTMVDRLRSPSFILDVAKDVGDEQWAIQIRSGVGSQVLMAQAQKSLSPTTESKIVEVKVRARSPEYAKKIAENAIAKVIKRQDELSAQALEKIRFDLAVAKERLVKSEQDLAILNKTLAATAKKEERSGQVALLTMIMAQKQSEILSLRQSVFSMEISLLPPLTQPARALEAIFVSLQPVSPNSALLLALGLVGGLLLGVTSVFVSGAWRQARERCLLAESGKA